MSRLKTVFRRLPWNLIGVEGTGLKRAPYRSRKIVQKPAPDLANWGGCLRQLVEISMQL